MPSTVRLHVVYDFHSGFVEKMVSYKTYTFGGSSDLRVVTTREDELPRIADLVVLENRDKGIYVRVLGPSTQPPGIYSVSALSAVHITVEAPCTWAEDLHIRIQDD